MKDKNQTGLKSVKPKINLNHNIFIYLQISHYFMTDESAEVVFT